MFGPDSFGAVPKNAGTQFLVWALGRSRAAIDVDDLGSFPLVSLGDGYFGALIEGVHPGARYWLRFDDGPRVPDLASRWQPEGSEGPSVVVDSQHDWSDRNWMGVGPQDQVIYELHIGTFTPEGSWRAALAKLEGLRDLGVTMVQIMPVGTYKGKFGWGYDTVLPYAPFAPYGTPDDMRAFVDAAHQLGIGVILDVVYNHAGLGDHYRAYSDHYFTTHYENEWGASFNYDGEGASAVRDFMVGNAAYWVRDFHIDGLRVDAVQAMFDSSDEHIVAEIISAVREAAAPRLTYIVVENQPQERLMVLSPEEGGNGADAMMSDDFHHAARVAVTGHDDFYYRDYRGSAQELVSALKYGFLYQGQRSDARNKTYGTYNLDTPSHHFVHFLENHDQVANSARGFRLSSLLSPARLRAVTSLLLLGPQTPALFQGQEFGATNPFLYFFGITGDDAQRVREGRQKSLSNFPGVSDPVMLARLADPSDPATFELSRLDWSEAERNSGLLALHRDLIALRRADRAFSQASERRVDGAVIGDAALLIRYLTPEADGHRLLMVNLDHDLHISGMAEPLLAPPDGHRWVAAWSSEHPDYDGAGVRPADPEHFWILPGDSAVLFRCELCR